VEILRALYDGVARHRPGEPDWPDRDRVILSKGHGCVALYAILADHGYFSPDTLATLCARNSILGGHPERHLVPGVEFSTGSLGHGLSVGVGMALALRKRGLAGRVFVVLGDGELGEGSVWEAISSAAHHDLASLCILVDRNRVQSSGPTAEVLDLEPLVQKLRAFGCGVAEVDGHDVDALRGSLATLPFEPLRPSALVCNTTKGRGIPAAEGDARWHYRGGLSEQDFVGLRDALDAAALEEGRR
jgi:transketolase